MVPYSDDSDNLSSDVCFWECEASTVHALVWLRSVEKCNAVNNRGETGEIIDSPHISTLSFAFLCDEVQLEACREAKLWIKYTLRSNAYDSAGSGSNI